MIDKYSIIYRVIILALILTIIYAGNLYSYSNDIKFYNVLDINIDTSGAIIQDIEGFIWIGTEFGLVRYDAYELKYYKSSHYTLSNDTINTIVKDDEGYLWIGTNDGLNMFNKKNEYFTVYKNNPDDKNSISSNHINCILQDSDGYIWIGTRKGLNRLDKSTGEFKHYKNNIKDSYSIINNHIQTIIEDKNGNIWIGTVQGVCKLDRNNDTFIRYKHNPDDNNTLSSNFIYGKSICEDRNGNIWIGTYGGGLNLYDDENNTFIQYKKEHNNTKSLVNNKITSIIEDKNGRLWIGAHGGGISILDIENKVFRNFQCNTHHNCKSEMMCKYVNGLYEDRKGIIWIVFDNGRIDKYDKYIPNFNLLDFDNYKGISSTNYFSGVIEKDDNNLWVSKADGSLYLYDTDSNEITPNKYSSGIDIFIDDYITSLHKDNNGKLWFGTNNGVLCLYNTDSGKIVYLKELIDKSSNIKKKKSISTIIDDKNNPKTLWIGTESHGLYKFDKETKIAENYRISKDSNINLTINNIYDNEDGFLWLASKGQGLLKFNKITHEFFSYKHNSDNLATISSNEVLDIYMDSSNLFWVGTHGGGLNLFRKSSGDFQRYDLPLNSVYGIIEDDENYLWISGDTGLIKMNILSGLFLFYDMEFELNGNLFNKGSALKTEEGMLYFGGKKGITHFNPKDIPKNLHQPYVKITEIKINNKEIKRDENHDDDIIVDIKGERNLLEFRYSSLNYTLTMKNQYSYMLHGKDNNWIIDELAGKRYARYYDLNSGLYEFHVKASNNDGVWNETGDTIKVNVYPELYDDLNVYRLSENENSQITIKPDIKSFLLIFENIDFSIINYDNKYMLEGYDIDWMSAGNKRVVQYNNLPAGNYMFKYKKSIYHDEKSLRIKVLSSKSFIQKNWKIFAIYIPAFLFIAGIFYFLLINRQLIKKKTDIIVSSSENYVDERIGTENEQYSKVYDINYDFNNSDSYINEQFLFDDYQPRILVVDDERTNLQALKNHLILEGYEPEFAESGQEALELLNNGNIPDLIILDIMMPQMSGFAVCENIRKMYSLYELPIIMLTARRNPDDLVLGFKLGANDYLTKPFNHNEMKARIKTLLRLKLSTIKIRELNNNLEIKVKNRTQELKETNESLKIEIQNRKKQEELVKVKANRINILNKIISAGNYSSNLESFVNDILDIIIEMTEIKAGNIYIIDDKSNMAHLLCHRNMDIFYSEKYKKIDIHELPQEKIFIDGNILINEDFLNFEVNKNTKSNLRICLILPLKSKDKIIGSMTFLKMVDNKFSKDEIDIIQSIAFEIASMIVKIKTEKALIESEKRYRSVVEDQTELIIRFKPDLNLTFVNGALYRYVKETFDLFFDFDTFNKHFKEAISEYKDELDAIDPENPIYSTEKQVILDENIIIWHRWTIRGIFNPQNEITEYQAVGRDISDIKKSEQRLRESEKKYRSLFSNMLNGLLYCKIIYNENSYPIDFIFIDANRAFENITGFRKDDIINKKGSDFKEVLDKISVNMVEIAIDVAIDGKSDKYEIYHEEPHDKWYYVHAYSNKNGYFALVFDDITERKRMEKQLKESEELYRAVVEDQTEFIARYKPDGNALFANDAYCNYFGYDKDEIIGFNLSQRIPEDRIEKYRKLANNLTPQKPVFVLEDISLIRTGHYIRWNIRAIFNDKDEIIEFLTVGRDITELKKSELALKESEKKFRAVFEFSPSGLLIFDSDNNLLDINQSALNMFGINNKDILMENYSIFFTPENTPDKMLKLIENNENISEEYSINLDDIKKDFGINLNRSGIVYIEISYTPIFFADISHPQKSFLIQLQDITDRKIAEKNIINQSAELRKINKDMESLSYTVSHDLQSPVNVIDNLVQRIIMINKNKLSEKTLYSLNNIKKTCDRMLKLISDILNLFEINHITMKYDKVNLTKMALEVIQREKEYDRNHFPRVIINPDMFTYGDEGMIRIMINNLLRNSWKFTKDVENPIIEFGKTYYKDEEVFYIKDNGIGFEQKNADIIFEAFKKLHNNADNYSKGIGLSIVKRVINKHNGRIWVKSKPNKGATFYFQFNRN